MATATWSGYQAAAQTVAFASGQAFVGCLDNEWSSLSDEQDNSTNKWLFADIEIDIPSYTAGSVGDEAIEIYIVPSADDSQYPSWTGDTTNDAQENNIHFVGSIPVSQGASVKVGVLRAVALPPGLWKMAVRNRSGGTIPASATLKYRPYGYSAA